MADNNKNPIQNKDKKFGSTEKQPLTSTPSKTQSGSRSDSNSRKPGSHQQ